MDLGLNALCTANGFAAGSERERAREGWKKWHIISANIHLSSLHYLSESQHGVCFRAAAPH
jgi:hypothetical protein